MSTGKLLVYRVKPDNDRGRDVIPAKAGTQTLEIPVIMSTGKLLGYRVKPDPMDMGQV
jgi:hypothetical protein